MATIASSGLESAIFSPQRVSGPPIALPTASPSPTVPSVSQFSCSSPSIASQQRKVTSASSVPSSEANMQGEQGQSLTAPSQRRPSQDAPQTLPSSQQSRHVNVSTPVSQASTTSQEAIYEIEGLMDAAYATTDALEARKLLQQALSSLQEHWTHKRLRVGPFLRLQNTIQDALSE